MISRYFFFPQAVIALGINGTKKTLVPDDLRTTKDLTEKSPRKALLQQLHPY
jgi:hypothetical protein